MKIAIDASRIVNEKAGVGRYSANLLSSLLILDKKNEYLLICSYFRGHSLKQKMMQKFAAPNVKIRYLRIPGKLKEYLWHSNLPFAKQVLAGADVYLAMTFLDVIANLDIPQAVVIHDLTTYKFPEHLGNKLANYFNFQTKFACQKAAKIIAISQSTKNDLVEILKVPKEKIIVSLVGPSDFPSIAANLPAGLKSKSYILAVGTVEPRKNLIGAFEAYAMLPPALQEKYPLVVVGAPGWNMATTFKVFSALNLENKVKFLGYVPDKILAKLYKEAAVFVFPSLYEGFGIPLLEAMEFSLPIITSNVSSLPEVAEDAAILVDPKSSKEISASLEKLLEHKDEAQKLGEKANKQAQKFSWERVAKIVSQTLNSLVK